MPIRSDNPIGRTPIVKVGQGRALRRWMESCALSLAVELSLIELLMIFRLISQAPHEPTNQRSMVMFLPLLDPWGIAYLACKKVGEIKRKEGMEGEGGKLRHAAIHTRSNRLLQGELPFPDIALRENGRISSNRGLFSHLLGMNDGRNGPNLILLATVQRGAKKFSHV